MKPLRGWKAIASFLGVSLRTAIRLKDLQPDPLPVRKFFGSVEATPEELRAWRERQLRIAV